MRKNSSEREKSGSFVDESINIGAEIGRVDQENRNFGCFAGFEPEEDKNGILARLLAESVEAEEVEESVRMTLNSSEMLKYWENKEGQVEFIKMFDSASDSEREGLLKSILSSFQTLSRNKMGCLLICSLIEECFTPKEAFRLLETAVKSLRRLVESKESSIMFRTLLRKQDEKGIETAFTAVRPQIRTFILGNRFAHSCMVELRNLAPQRIRLRMLDALFKDIWSFKRKEVLAFAKWIISQGLPQYYAEDLKNRLDTIISTKTGRIQEVCLNLKDKLE